MEIEITATYYKMFFYGMGGIAQGTLSIFRGFCDGQINIPYILNIS